MLCADGVLDHAGSDGGERVHDRGLVQPRAVGAGRQRYPVLLRKWDQQPDGVPEPAEQLAGFLLQRGLGVGIHLEHVHPPE